MNGAEVLEETLGRDAPSQSEAFESALQVLAALNLIAESRPNPASPISVIELVRKQSKKHCCRFVAAILSKNFANMSRRRVSSFSELIWCLCVFFLSLLNQ